MRTKITLLVAAVSCLTVGSVLWSDAQQLAVPAPPQAATGGFVPGQKRAAIDPAIAARGKTLFGVSCQGCHGQDLRGGDLGGPNLLRSQVTLSDQDGELIVPIIQGSRQAMGMPNIGLNLEDSKAVAAYVRSVVAMIGVQGTPPGQEKPLNVVTGNAAAGQAFFAAKCAGCHSAEGDLRGVATRVPEPRALQAMWVSGVAHGMAVREPAAKPMASVSLPSGDTVDGTMLRMDDFLITLRLPDETVRSFRRNGETPKVVVRDPAKGHKDLLPLYTDKDIHDVTAFLVTLK